MARSAAVPLRGNGRQPWHRERWCLLRFLEALACHGGLDGFCQGKVPFPLSVLKDNGPDFLLGFPEKGKLGIEIVEVATSRHQSAMTRQEQMPPRTRLVGEDELVVPSSERRRPIARRMRPWMGEEPEERLTGLVLARVRTKTVKLNEGYQPACHLLLYDSSHVPAVDLNTTVGRLHLEISKYRAEHPSLRHFEDYHLLRDSALLFGLLGRQSVLARFAGRSGAPAST